MPRCPACGGEETLLESVDPVNQWRCDGCGHTWLEESVSPARWTVSDFEGKAKDPHEAGLLFVGWFLQCCLLVRMVLLRVVAIREVASGL